MINHSHKATHWIFIVTVLLFLNACSDQQEQKTSNALEPYKGQWLAINYWASWCKPCIEEIPELNQFAQQAKNTQVFAVNFDQLTGQELESQAQKIGIHFQLLQQDPATELNYPRPTVLPTTIILNPNGQVHRTLLGPQTAASLHKAIQ